MPSAITKLGSIASISNSDTDVKEHFSSRNLQKQLEAWEAGSNSQQRQNAGKQAVVDKGKHGKKAGGLTLEDSAKAVKNLNSQQRSAVDAANVLAAMGLNVTVYTSTEAQRKAGMENGNIRLSDGGIRVDLNAGMEGQGVMAWALSHEFTHFVEEMSPEKFHTFTDILFEELSQKNIDADGLIQAKAQELRGMEAHKNLSENKLQNLAYSEAVAEMMETELTDTDAISRISQKLQQEDKSLWGRIKDFLKGLVDRLKDAYRGLTPDSRIAATTREAIASSEAILNAYVDAAADAVENYNLQEGQKNNTPEGVKKSPRVGTAEDGRSIYEGSFPKGTPKLAKSKVILEYIQNVWSKKPISLKITDTDGSQRTILAQFDPTYDPEIRGDASKIAGGNRHGNAVEQRVTLDLGPDYYDILSESTFHYSKPEIGKDAEVHRGVKTWHYFVDEIYFAEKGSQDFQPFTVSINVKEKANGNFVYSFSAEKGEFSTPGTLHAQVSSPVSRVTDAELSGESILQPTGEVKEDLKKSSSSQVQKEGQKSNAPEDVLKSPRMSPDMSEQERYDKLKDLSLTVKAVANQDAIAQAEAKYGTDIKDGVHLKSNDRKKLFQKIADVFGIIHNYSNQDVKLEFIFSNENLKESLNKQGRYYYSFMKMLSCFDDVIDSAIGIETHNRNNIGYKPDASLQNVYVLVSAFRDGDNITPVKLEIKEFSNKPNTLYVAIALDSISAKHLGIKKGEIDTAVATDNGSLDTAPSPSVRLSDLFANVNPKDTSFLKYVPTQFFEESDLETTVLKSSRNPQKQLEAWETENERLKLEVEYLQKVVQIHKQGNRDYTLDKNSLKSQALDLMKSNNAKGDASELAAMMDELYRYFATDENWQWDELQEKAGKAADWLMEHQKHRLEDYAQSALDWMAKRRVRLNDAQIGEIQYQFGSLSEFKKAVKGTIIIDQQADTQLDQLWQEGVEEYGYLFDKSVSDADMPRMFAQLVQGLKDSKSVDQAELEYGRENWRADLTRQVLDKFHQVKPVESVSDKMKQQIQQLKQEHKEAIAQLKSKQKVSLDEVREASKRALAEYRRQRDITFKAKEAVYNAELEQIKKAHERDLAQLRTQYGEDTKTMQTEFIRLLREYDASDPLGA